MADRPIIRTAGLTALALIAFAANSFFNKAAFADGAIDYNSFAIIRLLSAAMVLLVISMFPNQTTPTKAHGSNRSAGWLFAYATAFSAAYVDLSVGTGALILFAAVQLTMLLTAMRRGEAVGVAAWSGVLMAFGGLGILLFPGISAPSLWASTLMAIAGVSWGFYSLAGRDTTTPLADTAANFVRTVPFAIGLGLLTLSKLHVTQEGAMYALLSGVIASGIGYTIWYAALQGLSSTQAAVVQLLVPVLASIAGILFLSEAITDRFVLSTGMILVGVAVAVLGKRPANRAEVA